MISKAEVELITKIAETMEAIAFNFQGPRVSLH